MDKSLITDLLDDFYSGKFITEEERDVLQKSTEKVQEVAHSEEFRKRVESSQEEYIKNDLVINADPEPVYTPWKNLLKSQEITVKVNDIPEEVSNRLTTAEIFKPITEKQGFKVPAPSLLPKKLLRLANLPKEANRLGNKLINQSRDDLKELSKKIDRKWVEWNESFKSPAPMENWTSTDLYESGSLLYQNNSEAIFIFSTTSGLVVPSEYAPQLYGYDEINKDPHRMQYFDNGLLNDNTKLKRFYQWNRYSTASGLFKNCEMCGKERIRQASVEILGRALRMPNFAIVEADFGAESSEMAKAKIQITLCCRNGGVASNRGEIKKISHCDHRIMPNDKSYRIRIGPLLEAVDSQTVCEWDIHSLDHQNTSPVHTITWVMRNRLFNSEEVQIIKNIDDPAMDEISAHKKADEVFERLYKEGERIHKSGLTQEDLMRGK